MVGQIRVKNSDRLSARGESLVVCEGIKTPPRSQIQKQPFILVLLNSCSERQRKVFRKIHAMGIFLNIEKSLSHKTFPCECCEIFQNRFFTGLKIPTRLKASNFIKKETLTQALSSEF